MNPINQRRWANFKSNKRGYFSVRIFALLFVISLFAEFIANDKPIILSLNGEIFLPVWFSYAEVELGGVMETEANYLDPFVLALIDKNGWAIWPPVRYSFETIDWNLEPPFPHPPGREHWLGTDGRNADVFAKLLYAFRLSIVFGISLTIITSTVGIAVGAIQGYFGGLVDLVGQRMVEVWAGIPALFILVILASLVEPNVFWLLGIMSLLSWMTLVGVVRAEFLRARNFEFVRAAQSLGVNNPTIMTRHILPNAMVATLTFLPFILTTSIGFLTALDFLGFGLPPDSPSFGRLLSAAKANLQAPWIGISTFITLAVMLILLIFTGEAIRDALDPRSSLARVNPVP